MVNKVRRVENSENTENNTENTEKYECLEPQPCLVGQYFPKDSSVECLDWYLY